MSNLVTSTKPKTGLTSNPIVMSSVFKSGTWLLRHLLEEITGLNYHEPSINRGAMNPANPDHIEIQPDHFYSWHFTPSDEIQNKLIHINAKPIFLMRNIYDLVVSMYYHFANNIDHEIGRGANKQTYFSQIDKSSGLQMIITGCDNSEFRWKGIGPHLYQMECMLQFSNIYPCHLVSYENIVTDKKQSIKNLSRFLGTPISQERLASLVDSSEFDTMKTTAKEVNAGSHYRLGKTSAHTHELSQEHIKAIQHCLSTHAPNLSSLAEESGFSEIIQCNH